MIIRNWKRWLQGTWVAGLVVAAGLSTISGYAPKAMAGTVSKPSLPLTFSIPSTPIVSASQEVTASGGAAIVGYLPGSGSVGVDGSYSYTIPLDVPAGRNGVQPHLALTYNSRTGNGPLGVGWSISGLSAISRCDSSLSTEGLQQGVHMTDFSATPEAQRDRFCLDGKKLIAINGAYGADQAEYRTEQDSNQRIISHSTSTYAYLQGPESFTVLNPDGVISTYTGQTLSKVAATATTTNSPNSVRAEWLLTSSVDSLGNGVQYNYQIVPSGDNTAVQVELQNIQYTTYCSTITNCANPASTAYRMVQFSYQSRPDQEVAWRGGVKTQLLQLLKSITMQSPSDDALERPVWTYQISYNPALSSFSGRSLLSAVQRCAIQGPSGSQPGGAGGCTWAKQFSYTTSAQAPVFTAATPASNFTIAPVPTPQPGGQSGLLGPPQYVFGGPMPMIKVLDANGDSVDDILLQYGQTLPWMQAVGAYASQNCNPAPNYPCQYQLPNMIAPVLRLGSSAANGTPLGQEYDLSGLDSGFSVNGANYGGDLFGFNNANPPPAWFTGQVGYYPWASLENLTPVDWDGNGRSSIFMAAPIGTGGCTYRALDWGGYFMRTQSNPGGLGLKDRGIELPMSGYCNDYAGSAGGLLRAATAAASQVLDVDTPPPNPAPYYSFLDIDGDNRPDVVGYVPGSSGSPDNNLQFQFNVGGNALVQGAAASLPPNGISPDCPYYFVDFSGDGRGAVFGQTLTPGVGCTSSGTYSFSPGSGSMPASYPLIIDSNQSMPDLPAQSLSGASSPTPAPQFYGDFNGDGLQDLITLDPSTGNMTLRWNTGNGFTPAVVVSAIAPSIASTWWGSSKIVVADVNGDGRDDLIVFNEHCLGVSNKSYLQGGCLQASFKRAIVMMLSNGDGTFNVSSITAANQSTFADPGLLTPEGWTTSVLGDFNGDGMLDIADVVGGAPQNVATLGGGVGCFGYSESNAPSCPTSPLPGSSYQITTGSLQTLTQQRIAVFPGSTTSQPKADLLAQIQDAGAALPREAVFYDSKWSDKPEASECPNMSYPQRCLTKGVIAVRAVQSYDSHADSFVSAPHQVSYSYEEPTIDLRGRGFLGFRKVRVWDPTRLQQTITIYDNVHETGTAMPPPVAQNPYPSSPPPAFPMVYGPGYYPNTAKPLSVTTVTAIPMAGTQTVPAVPLYCPPTGASCQPSGSASVNARVEQTIFNYQFVSSQIASSPVLEAGNSLVYAIWPATSNGAPAKVTSEWEQAASLTGSVTDPSDPTSDFIWFSPPSGAACQFQSGTAACAASASAIVHTTTIPSGGIDPYGNVLAETEQTSTGAGSTASLGATVSTVFTYNNITSGSTWLIGQLATRVVTGTDADPAVQPVVEADAYDYTGAGLLHDHYICQQGPATGSSNCPLGWGALSTTTLTQDSYGNVVAVATTAQGPDGLTDTRQVNIEYDALWPSEPNERIYPSQYWSPLLLCKSTNGPGGSCLSYWTPTSWVLIHPAYGVAVASMDANGVESTAQYDDSGRPLTITPAAGLPTTISYAGRTDQSSQGGLNGMIVTSTTGGQTQKVYSDSAGHTLQSTHLNFDGSLVVDGYTHYDLLGRAVSTTRPYSCPSANAAGGLCTLVPVAGSSNPTLSTTTPSIYFSVSTYDGLNRLLSTSRADPTGGNTNYGSTTTCQTPPNCISTTTYAYGALNSGTDVEPKFAAVTAVQNGATTTLLPAEGGLSRTVTTVTTIDPAGNKTQTETDIDGRTMQTANYLTGSNGTNNVWLPTYYHYAAFGAQDRVMMPSGTSEGTAYDALARVTSHYSADVGATAGMIYDGFGELLQSQRLEGGVATSTTLMRYDPATGRQMGWSTCDVTVTAPSPNPNPSCAGLTTGATFSYDTQAHGLGRLAGAVSSDNVSIVPAYDSFGRTTSMTETVNGQPYTIGSTYYPQGQAHAGAVQFVNYPAVAGNSSPGVALEYLYNTNEYMAGLGAQAALPNASSGSSLMSMIWGVNSRNADGTLAQATAFAPQLSTIGNTPVVGTYNYSYVAQTGQMAEASYFPTYLASGQSAPFNTKLQDLTYGYYSNGLARWRNESVNGRYDYYSYDSLHRLAEWDYDAQCPSGSSSCTTPTLNSCVSASGSAMPMQQYAYDNDGDLTKVTSCQSITNWGPNGQPKTIITRPVLQTLTYGLTSGTVAPHQLATPGGASGLPSYDTHGRQIANGTGRSIVYNAYDLPRTITQNGNVWTFQYDAFGRRASKTSSVDGTTIYIGGAFERRVPAAGCGMSPAVCAGATDVFIIPNVGQIQTVETAGAQTQTANYVLTDAQGTTTATVQVAPTSNGGATEAASYLYYDPFGVPNNELGSTVSSPINPVHDRYTSQEDELWEFGLINFQGRMYDPNVRRFLTTDPHVTAPGFGQSWNPYSYVLNNPINLVDPTGLDGEPDSEPPPPPPLPDYLQGIPFSGGNYGGDDVPFEGLKDGQQYIYCDGANSCFLQMRVDGGSKVLAGPFVDTRIVSPAPGPTAATVQPVSAPQFVNDGSVGPTVQNSGESKPEIFGFGGGHACPPECGGEYLGAPGAATVAAAGAIVAGPAVVSGTASLARAAGTYTGVTPIINSGRVAAGILTSTGGGLGLGSRASLALWAGAAEFNGWGILGGGALVAGGAGVVAGSNEKSLRNPGFLGTMNNIPRQVTNNNGAFGFGTRTNTRVAQTLAQKIAAGVERARIFVLTGGHGAGGAAGNNFINVPSLRVPTWFGSERPQYGVLPLQNDGTVMLLDGNNPEHLQFFLEMEQEAAVGGSNIFTIRDYCFSDCDLPH